MVKNRKKADQKKPPRHDSYYLDSFLLKIFKSKRKLKKFYKSPILFIFKNIKNNIIKNLLFIVFMIVTNVLWLAMLPLLIVAAILSYIVYIRATSKVIYKEDLEEEQPADEQKSPEEKQGQKDA